MIKIKKILFSILFVTTLTFFGCNTSTVEDPQENTTTDEDVESIDVSVSITIPQDVEKGDALEPVTITAQENDTIIDVTERAGASIEMNGSGDNAYVEGINGLSAFDEGPESGWLVKVNGELLNESAGAYTLKSDDTIEWLYILDFTEEFEE